MITIEVVNADALLGKFNALEKRIDELPKSTVPEELTAWQKEDMNRQWPNTEMASDGAATNVWSRSRLELKGEQRPRPKRRIYTRRAQMPSKRPGPSSRPILRDVLKQKLIDRMCALLRKTTQWA
jgi:hypothetical protein